MIGLDYRYHASLWRWWKCASVLFVCAVVTLFLVRDTLMSSYARLRLLALQRGCMNYHPSKDQAAGVNVGPYKAFCERWNDPWMGGHGREKLLFLGKRTTPDGRTLLLAIPGELTSDDPIVDYKKRLISPNIDWAVMREDFPIGHSLAIGRGSPITPATWSRLPKVSAHPEDGAFFYIGRGGVAKVYMGEPDPVDASHFTIRYESEGETGMIDGWLQDNLSVKIKIRDGPATKYAEPEFK